MNPQHKRSIAIFFLPSLTVFAVLGGGLFYQYTKTVKLEARLDSLASEFASTTKELSWNAYRLSQNVTDLRTETLGLSNTIKYTQQNIDAVKSQVGGVAETVGSISGTVGNLQKLAEVDPELLQKYSKVYFLNENYAPKHLTQVPQDYVYSSKRTEQFLTEANHNLVNLLLAAQANGVSLYVKSAFRSFVEQKSLKSAYSTTYGAGTANTFSADQGYSEHQLGTAIDFITVGLGGQLAGFDNTPAYKWLLDNAHFYGFVLSYPKGNKFYVYEPWHWRFVGIKLATYLHTNNMNFYDMDQREIDKYLVNIFE